MRCSQTLEMLTNKQTTKQTKTIMAYKQKNSPFKQTALENIRSGPFQNNANGEPEFREVRIGDRPKRGLKDAYDIALKKGYRKKSESFADYSKRAKADPLYGKSGSKGFSVTGLYGDGFDGEEYENNRPTGFKVKDIAEGEALVYAEDQKKLRANASKIRKGRKLNEQALKNKPKVKEAKEVKLEPQKINTPKKTTKVTVSRRDQRRLDKQAKREAKIAETRKKGKAALASGDKAAANRLRRKQARIEGRIAKTDKKMSKPAEDKSKVETKVKARRRAAKGSTRATLRK
jgi:hypothetical protein